MSDSTPTPAEEIARLFHDTYERLAPSFGYETRLDTKKFDPESKNGMLMIAVCKEIMYPFLTLQLENERLKARQSEIEVQINEAGKEKHGASGLCCQLRESEYALRLKAEAKLTFLASKGLTVGLLKDGHGERLAYVIEPGSELCDLATQRKLVDAEIARDKALAEVEQIKTELNAAKVPFYENNEEPDPLVELTFVQRIQWLHTEKGLADARLVAIRKVQEEQLATLKASLAEAQGDLSRARQCHQEAFDGISKIGTEVHGRKDCGANDIIYSVRALKQRAEAAEQSAAGLKEALTNITHTAVAMMDAPRLGIESVLLIEGPRRIRDKASQALSSVPTPSAWVKREDGLIEALVIDGTVDLVQMQDEFDSSGMKLRPRFNCNFLKADGITTLHALHSLLEPLSQKRVRIVVETPQPDSKTFSRRDNDTARTC